MANSPIREFDAKNMFFSSIWKKYWWMQITQEADFVNISQEKKYVIKPDELFWKRGKLWLIWVKLSWDESKKWFLEKSWKEIKIKETSWILNTFLLEEFIPHKEEYYIAIKQEKEFDEIFFSNFGWIDVEENWEKVLSLKVWVLEELSKDILSNIFWIFDEKILQVIFDLFAFYRQEDFTYLEVNPFCFDERNGELILLDMVAKVDDSAFFLHPETWENLEFPNAFWFEESENEKYIKELDQKTGASLKLKFLNTKGKIWTLLSWGWGSLVITDTLWYLWYAKELANYWELSWDPDRYFTREYTKVLFDTMLSSQTAKYLIIAGAIANFTQIDKTFTGIIDVLEEKAEEIKKQNIQILVRRWWLNDKIWLKLLSDACERLWISCKVTDSNVYMTDILKEIKL